MPKKLADAAKTSPQPDRPWLFRTYSGHSSAKSSNELYLKNLGKGQTGLSVAFDLPTQTGYDSDHVLAAGEVGKVGVPISHLGDMEVLFDGIPLDKMNTSMTINAPTPWMLALYIAAAERQGADRNQLSGTTQNDILKEYLSRGTYIFPPEPSMKMVSDVISFTCKEMPKWNPTNICSYHLQEAGATPVQELSYALSNAVAVLDAVKKSGAISDKDFPAVVGRISFFVNAGIRFVTELCKMRAFTELWDEITATRYAVTDPKMRRFRYGVQVNSLGLTEQQPENNVYRILLEMLAVVLSKNARARAVQLPAWNEALGLPRPWDQQWSLRLQQIVAYETDLLDYGDLFDGSTEVTAKVENLKQQAREEMTRIDDMGGAENAISYMKLGLVESNAARMQAIETGKQKVIGVNAYKQSEASPLTSEAAPILNVDVKAESEQIERLKAWRENRDDDLVEKALADLETSVRAGENIMQPSIQCAHAGVTTGEWASKLRHVFGEYRGPTGVQVSQSVQSDDVLKRLNDIRARIDELSKNLGARPKILVGKPGLDGHSNGAEQIAVRARDCGFEVIYEGIRLTPKEIARAALQEGVDIIGLSVLSGSHVPLVKGVLTELEQLGLDDLPVVVGGIIPPGDGDELLKSGVHRIYTPKDFDLFQIMDDLVEIIHQAN